MPRLVAGADEIGAASDHGANATGVRPAETETDGQRVGGLAGNLHERQLHLASVRLYLEDVAFLPLVLVGGADVGDEGVVPTEFGERLGEFLQPADVGEAPVEDVGVGAEDDLHAVGGLCERDGGATGRSVAASAGGVRDESAVQDGAPLRIEVAALELSGPVLANEIVGADAGHVTERGYHVIRGLALVERLDERLHDGHGAVSCAGIAP